MIYCVESDNEGCRASTLHISCNLEMAFDVLVEENDEDEGRKLTVICPTSGNENKTYWHTWKSPINKSIYEIEKELECCN